MTITAERTNRTTSQHEVDREHVRQRIAAEKTERFLRLPHLLFMLCADFEHCTHRGHLRSAKAKLAAAQAGELEEFAAAVHEAQCATWAHRSHSGFYLQRADDACGVGACKHIAYIADLPWIVAVHQKLTA